MDDSTKLSERCEAAFEDPIIAKGEECWKSGAVGPLKLLNAGLTATVKESSASLVDLFWGNGQKNGALNVACTCDAFADDVLCQHIWAVILKTDSEGYGKYISSRSRLMVIPLQETRRLAQGSTLENETLLSSSHTRSSLAKGAVLEEPDLSWSAELKKIKLKARDKARLMPRSRGETQSIVYVLDKENCHKSGRLCLKFYLAKDKARFGSPLIFPFNAREYEMRRLTPELRRPLAILLSLAKAQDDYMQVTRNQFQLSSVEIGADFIPEALALLCPTNLFYKDLSSARGSNSGLPPQSLNLDTGESLKFSLDVKKNDQAYELDGQFSRADGKRLLVSEINLFFPSGYLLSGSTFYKFSLDHVPTIWVQERLNSAQSIIIPAQEEFDFLESLLDSGVPVELPSDLQWPRATLQPQVHARFKTESGRGKRFFLRLEFDYGLKRFQFDDPTSQFIDEKNKKIVDRDVVFEKEALNAVPVAHAPIPLADLNALVSSCLAKGWTVEAEGKRVRQATDFKFNVSSGIDWLGLDAEVQFDGVKVSLPALIAAATRQESLISLGDGTFGVLPENWLKKYAPLAKLGATEGDTVRFRSNQAFLLDTWLATEKNINLDHAFTNLLKGLETLKDVKRHTKPATFKGKLRSYQEEGLGWLHALKKLSLGGILADDMGLGKTVQCLAFLDGLTATTKKDHKPSLIVVPKSLIFNWLDESSKFTPRLKVLNHTGVERGESLSNVKNYDIILTTYHTMRIDIAKLKDIDFSCAIIDEAQNIKNKESLAAKAVKLLKADFKLAMTGTPVENSIDDLYSIMDFVNPGLLGSRAIDIGDENILSSLSRALAPFILRRTKSQVLKDLPEKSEQVVHIELHENHRKEYDELKKYFRLNLNKEIKDRGLAKSQIQVLTALLRLRQAALHPGLLDKKRINEPSAKLDMLVENLNEAIGEGHKALVFSQFTSLLNIVKARFKVENIKYQYIDGKTTDRQGAVEAFKTDPDCKVFLISLKAGGTGLNLTEADYVFLLDPWWNPAVEAQAIDRTHRIGQKNKVLAYKFIAKDTVEEKILELQKSKKNLANALVSSDKGFLKSLTVADLNMLFS